jgi:hypothetical protein
LQPLHKQNTGTSTKVIAETHWSTHTRFRALFPSCNVSLSALYVSTSYCTVCLFCVTVYIAVFCTPLSVSHTVTSAVLCP